MSIKEAEKFFNKNVAKNFKIELIIFKQNKKVLKKYFKYKIKDLKFSKEFH